MTNPAQAKDIFLQALDEDSAEQRQRYLIEACGDDAELRRRVDALLAAHEEPESYLDRPAMEFGGAQTEDQCVENVGDSSSETIERSGALIGPYKLLQEIGHGGFGVVYMAEQQKPMRRQVALKIIKPGMDTREVIARFEAERQALALMDHPNIAKVFDAGATSNGRPYFVMELVKGVPMTEFCDGNRLTTRQRLDLFVTVCQAIQHAHQKGVIHRDLKPSNVMVTLHDGKPVPKVIDFGISKAISQRLTEQTLFTRYGQMVGTPQYMSPEQAEMSGLDVDTRSDIYSLGVLLYELLTGTTPIEADSLRSAGYAEMLRIIQEQESPRPSSRLSTLGERLSIVCKQRGTSERQIGRAMRGELDWIVMKSLDKDRSRRYDTADAFAADVERFLRNEPVSAVAPSPWYLLRKFASKHQAALAAVSSFVSLVFVTAVICSILAVRATRAKLEAQSALSQAEQATISAKVARDDERGQREIAETERQRANDEAEKARQNLYAADMKAVNNYLADGSLGAARALLESQLPRPGQSDLRGWEWRYFQEKAKGDHLFRLHGHSSIIAKLSFSPDGALLASRGYEESILWDWRNKTMLHQWQNVKDIGFSADGNSVGLLRNDGQLELADVKSHDATTLFEHKVRCFTFSPCDDFIAVAVPAGKILRWEYQTNEVTELCSLKRSPSKLVFSPSGDVFAWMRDGAMSIWNVGEAKITASVKLPPDLANRNPAIGAVFSGGKGFVVRARGIPPMVYRAEQASWESPFPKDTIGTNRMMLSRDGATLVTGSYNHDVSLWNVHDFEPIARLYGHGDEVFSVAITPDGEHLASGSQDKSILIWNANGVNAKTTIERGLGPMRVVHSEDGEWIATSTPFLTTTIRNPETLEVVANVAGAAVHELAAHNQLLTIFVGPSFKPGSLLNIGNEISFWNTDTWQRDKTVKIPSGDKIGVQTSGKHAVVAYESRLEMFDLTTGAMIESWQHGLEREGLVPLLPIAVSVGKVFAAGKAKDRPARVVKVWNSLGDLVAEFECNHLRQIVDIECSPDGKYVASASYDATIKVWDVETKTAVFTLRGHRRGIHSIDFSPDGKTLVSAADDGMVKLWHLSTGRELATFHPSIPVNQVQFSPDGRTLTGLMMAPPPLQSSKLQIWRAPN